MNLFLLSLNREECVRWYADKHIVKMILELTQLLYTVWGVSEEDVEWRNDAPEGSYKITHINHPISVWLRQNKKNYAFGASYAHPMMEEYTRRYKKIHSCRVHLDWLVKNVPPNLPNGKLTQMPQALPEELRINNGTGTMEDTINAYKEYYSKVKIKEIQMTYKNTPWPEWLPYQDPIEFKKYKERKKIELEELKKTKKAEIELRKAKKIELEELKKAKKAEIELRKAKKIELEELKKIKKTKIEMMKAKKSKLEEIKKAKTQPIRGEKKSI